MEMVIRNEGKADTFTGVFQYMKLWSEFITMNFRRDMFYIQCMDAAHVSIFEVRIPSQWFDEYRLVDDKEVCLSISSVIFFKIMNSRDKMQSMKLQYAVTAATAADDKIHIFFDNAGGDVGGGGGGGGGQKQNVFDKVFEVPLMELSTEMLAIPASEYQAEMAFPSSRFASIINELEFFGDTMNIQCSEESIVFQSTTPEKGKMSVHIKLDDLTSFSIQEDESLNLSFSLRYIHNMCFYHKLAKEITLHVSADVPMRVVYDLGDEASVMFYLAPKIGDDDNE